jgi:hypothetical protein
VKMLCAVCLTMLFEAWCASREARRSTAPPEAARLLSEA